MSIRTAIVGYGNLGRSVEKLIGQQPDMELVGIFSRRSGLDTSAAVYDAADAASHADEIDVLFLCLGSATDMPHQAPDFARHFTTVDTYDNHKLIPEHRTRMDEAARSGGNLALISTGWDPGLFSVNRTTGSALFPAATQSTFWGTGVSQGHSDAIRRVPGVKRAVQYTIPRPESVDAAKGGSKVDGREAHIRHCFIVPQDGADRDAITTQITTMPDYFVGYETKVDFIDDEQFDRDHQGMPHGGHVITAGDLGGSHSSIEFSLTLQSNPDFTAAVQVAYGRAAARLREQGLVGAVTVLEVAPYLLSPTPLDELISRDI